MKWSSQFQLLLNIIINKVFRKVSLKTVKNINNFYVSFILSLLGGSDLNTESFSVNLLLLCYCPTNKVILIRNDYKCK